MKWFRNNVKHGSRLALFALALQFVLSFGHIHALAAVPAPVTAASLAQSDFDYAQLRAAPEAIDEVAKPQPASNHDTDQPGEACAICAVLSLAGNLIVSTPPLLLLPEAIELLNRSLDAEFAHLGSVRAAFQSRAPPVS